MTMRILLSRCLICLLGISATTFSQGAETGAAVRTSGSDHLPQTQPQGLLGKLEELGRDDFPRVSSEDANDLRGSTTRERNNTRDYELLKSQVARIRQMQSGISGFTPEDMERFISALIEIKYRFAAGGGYRNVVAANYVDWIVNVRLLESLVKNRMDSRIISSLSDRNLKEFVSPATIKKIIREETGQVYDISPPEELNHEFLSFVWRKHEQASAPFAWMNVHSRPGLVARSLDTSYLLEHYDLPMLISRIALRNRFYATGLRLLLDYQGSGGRFPPDLSGSGSKTRFRRELEAVLGRATEKYQLISSGRSPDPYVAFLAYQLGLSPESGAGSPAEGAAGSSSPVLMG